VSCANAPVLLSGTSFISNTAGTHGGGVFVVGPVTLTGGRFENNAAQHHPGGLEARRTLTGTKFINNTATTGERDGPLSTDHYTWRCITCGKSLL